jgi:uncharacterized integral membrane protein
MNQLAELYISAVELAEAEGQLLRRKVVQTWVVVLLLFVAVVLFAAAITMALTSIHFVFAEQFSLPAALLCTSVVSLTFSGGILWLAKVMFYKT